jgi:hypothetical protein
LLTLTTGILGGSSINLTSPVIDPAEAARRVKVKKTVTRAVADGNFFILEPSSIQP